MQEQLEPATINRFAPITTDLPINENIPPPYEHGYSETQVIEITQAKENLEKRNLAEEPVTLEEFKTIIVPFQRIKRTTTFNLNPEKIKITKPKKEPKPKVIKPPKVKKLTKKYIESEMSRIIFAKAMEQELTEEDNLFIEAHTQKI